jgi:ATP-dependent DNA ligase
MQGKLPIYEVMGAKGIDKKDKNRQAKIDYMFNSPDYVGQRKLNGERLLSFIHWDETVQMFGRGSSKSGNRIEKTGLLPHLAEIFQETLPESTVLDGEVLFVPNNYSNEDINEMNFMEDFWKTREIMGSYPDKAVPQQIKEGWLHYFVFDILHHHGIELINRPYLFRYQELQNLIGSMGYQNYIHIVPIVTGTEEKRKLMDDSLSKGLEGIILKKERGLYYPGKKPTGEWVKIKREETYDCVIMGYQPAAQFTEITRNGKKVLDLSGHVRLEESRFYRNRWIGSIWVGQYIPTANLTQNMVNLSKKIRDNYDMLYRDSFEKDGITYMLVPVAKVSGMDDGLRQVISENKGKYLGKVVEISAFEKTDDSYFQCQFKGFRSDKPMRECAWEVEV